MFHEHLIFHLSEVFAARRQPPLAAKASGQDFSSDSPIGSAVQ
jgi:hypothetical protein